MYARRILTLFAVIGILFLNGCVATPYYGGGYYRGAAYGYGYQPSFYVNQGYVGGYRHFDSGHRYFDSGHKHFIGGHRHSGGEHRGGSHRGGHHHR
ncbi:hypothetical protein Nit79A3_1340 [Nitrosomonas sp. Is79A3]